MFIVSNSIIVKSTYKVVLIFPFSNASLTLESIYLKSLYKVKGKNKKKINIAGCSHMGLEAQGTRVRQDDTLFLHNEMFS